VSSSASQLPSPLSWASSLTTAPFEFDGVDEESVAGEGKERRSILAWEFAVPAIVQTTFPLLPVDATRSQMTTLPSYDHFTAHKKLYKTQEWTRFYTWYKKRVGRLTLTKDLSLSWDLCKEWDNEYKEWKNNRQETD
jgi:hypothetical protein